MITKKNNRLDAQRRQSFKPLSGVLFCIKSLLGFVFCVGLVLANDSSQLYEVDLNAPIENDDRQGSWLTVPIPISNPTVGSGLQFGLIYLHAPDSNKDKPNSTSGIAGMWTDSDSHFLGVFHDDNFLNDRFRLNSFAGVMDFNLDFFGIGSSNSPLSVKYNIRAKLFNLETLAAIPRIEGWYFGPVLQWLDSDITFSVVSDDFDIPIFTRNSVTSSLGLSLIYDSRNDNYYPTEGSYFNLKNLQDAIRWGSDYSFSRSDIEYKTYFTINSNNSLAFKLAMRETSNNTPFYLLANLAIRGVAYGRYIDNASFSLHSEWRVKLNQRWGLVTFVETGEVAASISQIDLKNRVNSVGLGVRWQAVENKKLNLGVDLAFLNSETTVYIRVGESF